jgi:hypothetical protein
VKPISGNRRDIIATADDIAVAFRQRIGLGTLIYLGTPIGPALWAGDAEATQWLSAVVSGGRHTPPTSIPALRPIPGAGF